MGVGLWATLTLLTALGHAWAKRVGKKKGKIVLGNKWFRVTLWAHK